MDADASALQRFTDVPYAIEAPASAGALAAAAAVALPRVGLGIDPRGLSTDRYRAMLARFRTEIAGRIPTPGGYRIDVLDRTAEDLKAEGRRVDRSLASYPEILREQARPTAFAGPYQGRMSMGCVITGFPPDYDFGARLAAPVGGMPVAAKGIDAEAFHLYALRHELGHCLLGSSEARAEAFAALMSLLDGTLSRDQLAVIAAFREGEEWTDARTEDGHFVSAGAWEVVRRADGLRASPRFMAMSVEEVARLARAVADRVGPSPAEIEAAKAVRRGLAAAAPLGGLADWIRAHRDLPVVGRIDLALSTLVRGDRVLPAHRIDLPALRVALAELSDRGDAIAARMLEGIDAPPPRSRPEPDFAARIPLARQASAFDVRALPEDLSAPAGNGDEAMAPGPR